MGIDRALYADYERAMRQVGDNVVRFEVSVFQLSCLVSLLQVAIKHTLGDPRVRHTAHVGQQLAEAWCVFLKQAHPALGRVAELGWPQGARVV